MIKNKVLRIYKYFHSQPVLFFLIVFSTGIISSWIWGGSVSYYILLSLAVFFYLTLFFLIKSRGNPFNIFAICLIILLGFTRGWIAFYQFSAAENNLFNKEIVAFQGIITDVDRRENKSDIYILHCEKVITRTDTLIADGDILIRQAKYEKSLQYGDVIRILGTPQLPSLPENPGEFNYRKYLNLNDRFFIYTLEEQTQIFKVFQGKGNRIQKLVFNPLREEIRKILKNKLNFQSATIVNALILGERGNLDKSTVEDFQKTGVVHVLAISGLHVGFIALLLHFSFSFLRIPKTVIMSLIVLCLIFFMALVNFKAPVVRASLMISFYYLSKILNRPQNTLNTTSLAAMVILIYQPEQLFLPGFQYSFAAVFGLIIGDKNFQDVIPSLSEKNGFYCWVNRYVRTPLIASLSAILATVPLTLYYFGNLQIGALFANIFVIPAIGLVVFLSIVFILFSTIWFLPSDGLATIINLLLDGLVYIISSFADIPFIQINVGYPSLFTLILMISIIILIFNIKNRSSRLGMLVVLCLLLFSYLLKLDKNKLQVTFISVGQGDAILIKFPNGKVALLDAGNKSFGFDAGKRFVDPVIKYNGIKKFDYLIASHPHSDHIGGFEYLLEQYPVDTLVLNTADTNSRLLNKIITQSKKRKTVIKRLDSGDMINGDRRVRIYILHPSTQFEKVNTHSGKSVNNSSLVLKMVHGNNSFLFMGDAEEESEELLINYKGFLKSDILKVGHHGSKTSSTGDFIDLVDPQFAIISAGKKNKFNHPSISTLEKFFKKNIPALRTDLNGAIIFESDGQDLKRIKWR